MLKTSRDDRGTFDIEGSYHFKSRTTQPDLRACNGETLNVHANHRGIDEPAFKTLSFDRTIDVATFKQRHGDEIADWCIWTQNPIDTIHVAFDKLIKETVFECITSLQVRGNLLCEMELPLAYT